MKNTIEIEFKYRLPKDTDPEEVLEVILAAYPDAFVRHISYVDNYYIHKENESDTTVPFFLRHRADYGLSGGFLYSELTYKSLLNCKKQGVRQELNHNIAGTPAEIHRFVSALGYTPVTTLHKSCIMV